MVIKHKKKLVGNDTMKLLKTSLDKQLKLSMLLAKSDSHQTRNEISVLMTESYVHTDHCAAFTRPGPFQASRKFSIPLSFD